MTAFFVDTSALAKRYIRELGSEAIHHILGRRENLIFISEFTGLEVISFLNRRLREQTISTEIHPHLIDAFLSHEFRKYVRVRIGDDIVARARDFVADDVLRPADAIQLATALFVEATFEEQITFLCADDALNKAAQAAGMAVLNPTTAPPPSS